MKPPRDWPNPPPEASGPVATCQPAVLLFRGRGAISAAIRWQTRSRYSHAALRLRDGRIVESWQGAGVQIKTLTDWTGIDAYLIPSATPAQWDEALDQACYLVGHGYDYWAIARFVSRRLMPFNDRWFCSELVFWALARAGVRLLSRISPAEVSPGLLALSPLLVPEIPEEGSAS